MLAVRRTCHEELAVKGAADRINTAGLKHFEKSNERLKKPVPASRRQADVAGLSLDVQAALPGADQDGQHSVRKRLYGRFPVKFPVQER